MKMAWEIELDRLAALVDAAREAAAKTTKETAEATAAAEAKAVADHTAHLRRWGLAITRIGK